MQKFFITVLVIFYEFPPRHITIQIDWPPVKIIPYFVLTKLIHNVPFAMKVLSFEMSNQVNLKTRLIKADIPSSKAQKTIITNLARFRQ